MGVSASGYEVWLPGYEPHQCGKPFSEEKVEGGIQEAYRKAAKFVQENPTNHFCTVGPSTWLRCWKVEHEPKFNEVEANVVLHLNHYYLNVGDDRKKDIMEDDGITVKGNLIF